VKVSILTPAFLSLDDKERNFAFQLGHSLVNQGVEVVLFTFTKALEISSSLLSEGVITLEGLTIKKYQPKVFRIIGMMPQLYSSKLIKDISQEHPDIVHIYGFSQFLLLFTLLRKLKTPVVLSPPKIHESVQDTFSSFNKKLFKMVIQFISKKVSYFIVDNPIDKNTLMNLGVQTEKIASIPHNIDYEKMASIKRREEDLILSVGRYAPNKGLHNLIAAARQILNTFPQIRFYLVGTIFDKEYHKFLLKKIEGFEDQIYLTGPLEEAKLLNLFSRAKLFVFPSINDTSGLVNIEAMAAGIPIIATKVEGTSLFIQDGVNGILIPRDDVPALVNSILELWKNKEKRNFLIKKGRERAKKFYWQNYSQEIIKIYKDCLMK